MVLRLLSIKQFSRCFVLGQNLTNLGFPSSRTLTKSATLNFPRGIKIKESLEDEDEFDDWGQFMASGAKSWDQESKIRTRFGSVRVDADNVALFHGQNDEIEESDVPPAAPEEKEEFGNSENVRLDRLSEETGDLSEALFEEEPSPEFFSPKEFNAKGKEGKSRPFLIREQSTENITIPIDFDKLSQKDSPRSNVVTNENVRDSARDSGEGEMNYLDTVVFGDAFKRFSSEDCNKEHSVKVDPEITDSVRKQLSETDLNEIDKEFFGIGVIVDTINSFEIDQSESKFVENLPFCEVDNNQERDSEAVEKASSGDSRLSGDAQSGLNYIDEQFFSVNSPSLQTESQSPHEPVTITPFHETPTENKTDSKNSKEKKKAKSRKENVHETPSENKTDSENTEEGKQKAKSKKEKKVKEKKHPEPSPAMDYVRKLRQSPTIDQKPKDPADQIGINLQARLNAVTLAGQPQTKTKEKLDGSSELDDNQCFLPVTRFCPPNLEKYTSIELEELLISKIIYNNHDIVGLWKPYGLPMFATDQDEFNKRKIKYYHNLEKYLPKLAAKLDCDRLYEVHRLDRTTTGVVLYARTEERRKHLKELLAKRKISKTYLAIVNGTPQPEQGIVNIPVSDGKIGDRFRKTLRPDYVQSSVITNKKNYKGNVSPAVTEYRTLGTQGKASLVEVKMLSGVKHQIRIHLGLGLGTPVLGDHKYSYTDQLGKPQRVFGDIANRMKVKKSKTRHLPIFLHARSVHIPEIYPDRDLWINANLPHFFSRALKTLKLKNAFD